MTTLRNRMIEAMQVRGFSVRTQRSYVDAVAAYAKHYGKSPDGLGAGDLRAYIAHLAVKRGLSGSSCRVALHGIRFLYLQVLDRPELDVEVPLPKRAQRIPDLLTRAEVARILATVGNPKHRMMLTLAYGCGLRVGELTALRVRDIDGERSLLRIEQGKGAKDRLVPLSQRLLQALREYWRVYRPPYWLFTSREGNKPLDACTVQKLFRAAKQRAGIDKRGGPHALRHAYATHQLENGLSIEVLQRLMGHNSIQTTLHYFHWIPGARHSANQASDLLDALEPSHV